MLFPWGTLNQIEASPSGPRFLKVGIIPSRYLGPMQDNGRRGEGKGLLVLLLQSLKSSLNSLLGFRYKTLCVW